MKRIVHLLLATSFSLFSCNNVKTYVVKWLNFDDTVLELDEGVIEGAIPSYDGNTPIREEDNDYTYTFSNWTPEITPVKEDISYKATYNRTPKKVVVSASHTSGFYDNNFSLTLTVDAGDEIYYTLDNTDPDETSLKYTSPIEITDVSSNPNIYSAKDNISSLDVFKPTELVDKCVVVKAIGINNTTKERSDIKTWNYFINYQNKAGYNNMPIISLSMDPDDLFSYEKGIYVTGKIYDESEHEGYPETWPANYNQKGRAWERKADFLCFNEQKEYEFSQTIGIRIHGGWSRAFNQKSFNLYARKEYSGTSTFAKAFFNDIHAHSLMLRSGGYRDTFITKVRDSLNQDMSQNELFSIQNSKPYIVFLNGEYWGIYNLQERYSDNYVSERTGVKKSNVLIIKNDELDEGDVDDYHYYEELREFFTDNDFSSNEAYSQVDFFIDVNEFAQYMSTQLYVGNIDWPGNNVRLYREVNTSNTKWHFMMYDTDDSSNILPSKCAVDKDPFENASHWKYGPLDDRCILGLMLSKLIMNASFKSLFRETFIRIAQENFNSNKVNTYLNAKYDLLKAPMVKNHSRFISEEPYSQSDYAEAIGVIKDYFANRYNYAITYLNNVL